MSYLRIIRFSFLCAVIAFLLTFGLACGEKPESVATRLAQEWASSSVNRVSDSLATAAVGEIPGLQQVATSVIRDQINKNITWSYSKPSKMSEDQYEVIATASAPLEVKVLVIQQSFSLSAEFVLTVDTKNKKIANWKLGSFRFAKR